EGRLRPVDPPLADDRLQAGVEALQRLAWMARSRGINARLEKRFERAIVRAQHLAGMRDRFLQHRGWRHSRRQAVQKRLIHEGRRLELALALEQPRLVQQRRKIARV